MEHDMVHISFFEATPLEEAYLKRSPLSKRSLRFFTGKIQDVDLSLLRNTDVLSVFIYSQLSRNIIAKMPQLKLVATRSTGFDHIDLGSCSQRKVAVANVPNYGEKEVS